MGGGRFGVFFSSFLRVLQQRVDERSARGDTTKINIFDENLSCILC
jgi:hypothetical protein